MALDKQPDYVKALVRRARAYESMREYEKAYADYGKAAGLGNAEAKVGEERARKAASGGPAQVNANADRLKEVQKMMDQYLKMGGKNTRGGKAAGNAQAQPQDQQQPVQADFWIVEFANLLRKHYGVDVDRPLIANDIASEKVNEAMMAMMKSEEDGPVVDDLLDRAALKFREQAALGMMGEAHVKDIHADRVM